jgi:hypothetical protein
LDPHFAQKSEFFLFFVPQELQYIISPKELLFSLTHQLPFDVGI